MSEDPPADLKKVGRELKRLRLLQRMSRPALEKKSGVSRSVIKELEAGEKGRDRRPGTFEALSAALEMDRMYLDDIMYGRREPETPETPEDQFVRLIRELREDFGGKFSVLEQQLRQIAAEQVRQGNAMAEGFDALNRSGGPGEVSVELPPPSHGKKEAPEK